MAAPQGGLNWIYRVDKNVDGGSYFPFEFSCCPDFVPSLHSRKGEICAEVIRRSQNCSPIGRGSNQTRSYFHKNPSTSFRPFERLGKNFGIRLSLKWKCKYHWNGNVAGMEMHSRMHGRARTDYRNVVWPIIFSSSGATVLYPWHWRGE